MRVVAPSPRSARALQPLCSSWQGRPRGSWDAGAAGHGCHTCTGAPGLGTAAAQGDSRGGGQCSLVCCAGRGTAGTEPRARELVAVGGKLRQNHWVATGTLRQVPWWPLRCHKPNTLKLQRRSCLHLLQDFPSTSEQFICPKTRIQPKKTGNPLWRSCLFGKMLQLGFLAMKRDRSSVLGLKQRQT